jgi:hypothetical protein
MLTYNYQQQNDLRKQLLVIKNLADNYPNSGSLNKALNNFEKVHNSTFYQQILPIRSTLM